MSSYISEYNIPEPPFDFDDFRGVTVACWWIFFALWINLLSFLGGHLGVAVGACVTLAMYIIAWLYMTTCPPWVMPWMYVKLVLGPTLFALGWTLLDVPWSLLPCTCWVTPFFAAFWLAYLFFFQLGEVLRSRLVMETARCGMICCVLLFLVLCSQDFSWVLFESLLWLGYSAIVVMFLSTQTMLFCTIACIYTYR